MFNSRLQPTNINLGTTAGATDKLNLGYDYGSTQNNGNVMSQTITVAGTGGFTNVQSYTYDELNRLKSASENSGTSWKQTFTYDRYGNRNFDAANTNQPTTLDAKTNPSTNTSNNRFNSGQGYSYDSSGNTTVDANGQNYTYDAENKQTLVTNGSGTLGQYWYDGDGKRIKKYVPSSGETTVFVYDASGKTVAEYSTNVIPAASAAVTYTTQDNLGTPRINTDKSGTATRHDYMPFGEEIIGLGSRSTSNGYLADMIREMFTGYERDNETDLDFAQARCYNKSYGRFTSVDPLAASASPSDPQSFDRYIYVRNSPLVSTDPTGKIPGDYYTRDLNYIGSDGRETLLC